MAKLETKDQQEQGTKDPFDTTTIEKELDELLRRRKLAREGKGIEEWIGAPNEGEQPSGKGDVRVDRQENEPSSPVGQEEDAGREGRATDKPSGATGAQPPLSEPEKEPAFAAGVTEQGQSDVQSASNAVASEREGLDALVRTNQAPEVSAVASPQPDASGSKPANGVILNLKDLKERRQAAGKTEREDGAGGKEGAHAAEEKETRTLRRPAKIAQVRSFVQTRFEEQNIEKDGLPIEQDRPKFVVTLPDEVYQIGKQTAPVQESEPSEPDDPSLTLEQYITGDIPAPDKTEKLSAPDQQEPTQEAQEHHMPSKSAKMRPRKLIDSRVLEEQPNVAHVTAAPSPIDPLFEEEEPLDFKTLRQPQPHPLDAMPGKQPVKELIGRAKTAASMVKLSLLLLLAQLAPLIFAFVPAIRPAVLTDHKRAAFLAGGLLLVQLALSFEVMRGAGDEWRQRRPATCNLVLFVCVLALLQTGIDATKGAAIVTMYPALLLFGALYNRRAMLKKAAADGRLVRSSKEKWAPFVLQTKDEPPVSVLVSGARSSFEGYFTRLFALSDVDKLATLLFPAGAALGALCLVLNKKAAVPLPALTVLLCAFGAVTPFSLLRAYNAPYIKLSNTLRRRGTTIAGADAAKELSSLHEMLLTDDEFFGKQAPTIAGVKLYNGHSLEESVLITASVAHILKLPTEHALLAMLDNRADRLMNLTEIKYLEGGGLSAFVGGTVVMLGNERFMKQNMIHVPKDDVAPAIEKSGRVPLYLACGGHMAAVFSVDYTIAPANARMLSRLTKAGIGLLLSTMDPLMTGELAEWIALLDAGSVRTINPREREDLLAQPREQDEATAISISDNPFSMAWSLLAASQLRTATRISAAVVLLAVVAGAVLCGVLLQVGALSALGLPGMMLFELVWMLPVWCVTALTTRIDR